MNIRDVYVVIYILKYVACSVVCMNFLMCALFATFLFHAGNTKNVLKRFCPSSEH